MYKFERLEELDLVGPNEIAERLNVKRHVVYNWVKRPWKHFPTGVLVSGHEVWHWPDIEEWAAENL